MKTMDLLAPRLCGAGRALALCASLALSACGGGGGSGGSTPPPVEPPAVVAPSIGSQPQDAKVADGATTTFSVTANGSSLTYQWQRDGKAISGATGTSYTTPVLHMADNGVKYQVVVTGPNASVTSNAVVLTVTPIALSLTAQPQAQTARDGEVATFDAAATGSEPIQYQWQRNGVPIAGADKSSYTTSALALADNAAVFKVVITNPAGSVSSQEAKLSVTAMAPRVLTDPDSVTTSDGANVTFKITAAGSAPLAYQWLRNGSPISGATDASYATTLTYAGNGDRYSVQVSNGAGKVTSAVAVATVNAAAPSISQHPADVSIATGGTATFAVSAGGTAPLRYQWQVTENKGLSWTNVAGATAASYAISNATLADTNVQMRVAVSNSTSTLYSNAASLTVKANVRILAGTVGGEGYADGKGSEARFDFCFNTMGADSKGNVYLVGCGVIRHISPDGTVKFFAGERDAASHIDGPIADARFMSYDLKAVLADDDGTVYVADDCYLRRISGGVVTSLGDGNCVARDGKLASVSFGHIKGLSWGPDRSIYLSERTDPTATFGSQGGAVVRKITSSGEVVTVAGSSTLVGEDDGNGTAARFFTIGKLVVAGNPVGGYSVYVVDGYAIRRISPSGDVSLYAGEPYVAGSSAYPSIGHRSGVRFGTIEGISIDAGGNLVVAESGRIARIVAFDGRVETAAPSAWAKPGGEAPADGSNGTVGSPVGLSRLPDGRLVFFDRSTNTVRTLGPQGELATLAGTRANYGFKEGIGAEARFGSYTPALVVAPSGELNLLDSWNRRIRRLNLGTNQLDSLPGLVLKSPETMVYDAAGNLYVFDSQTISRISSSGQVTPLAGSPEQSNVVDGVGSAAGFGRLISMVVDSKGNLIVAEAYAGVLRRVTPDGVVTTVAGKAGQLGFANGMGAEARFGNFYGLAIDAADNVYVADTYDAIRRMTPSGEVSTVAGAPNSRGLVDDVGAFARFSGPADLAFDRRGNLYVTDTGNNAIRRIAPSGQVSTVIGGSSQSVLRPGLGGGLNNPRHIVVTPAGRLVFLSESAIVGD